MWSLKTLRNIEHFEEEMLSFPLSIMVIWSFRNKTLEENCSLGLLRLFMKCATPSTLPSKLFAYMFLVSVEGSKGVKLASFCWSRSCLWLQFFVLTPSDKMVPLCNKWDKCPNYFPVCVFSKCCSFRLWRLS